jgi:MFS transporter, DHA1 family, inner membrane transport protein
MVRRSLPSLLVLCAAVFVAVTTELLPLGLLVAMSRDLSVSPGKVGLLVTGYAVMVALFAAPLGALTARLPRRPLLATALLAYAVSSAVMVMANGYALAFAARLLGGLTHGLFWAIVGGYAARLVAPERVGRAVAVVSSGGALAVLIGIPAGTAVGVAFGWRTAFAALTLLCVLVAVAAFVALAPVCAGGAPSRTPMRDVLRLPGFLAVVATTTATMLGAYALIAYTAPLLLNAGLPDRHLALVLLGSALAGGVMLPVAAWAADHRPRTGIIAGTLLIAAAPLVYLLRPHSAPVAVIAMTMGGMAMGLLPILLQAATLRAAPDHAEQASGINAGAFNLGVAAGALAGSLAWRLWGVAAVPVAGSIFAGAGLLIYLATGGSSRARA